MKIFILLLLICLTNSCKSYEKIKAEKISDYNKNVEYSINLPDGWSKEWRANSFTYLVKNISTIASVNINPIENKEKITLKYYIIKHHKRWYVEQDINSIITESLDEKLGKVYTVDFMSIPDYSKEYYRYYKVYFKKTISIMFLDIPL